MRIKLLVWAVLATSFLFLSLVYAYSRSNVTVIDSALQDNAITHKVFDEFTKGKRITGEFTPSQDYLGQFLIRFYTYNRINTDEVTFRIKEKGSSSWYYEHTYKTDQFLPDNLFTFGFPIIADSKGKDYVFEIESVNGTPDEAVTLSRIVPLAALSFQYPKALIIKNPSVALEFIKSKIIYQEINSDVIFSFLIYLNFIILVMFLEYIFLGKLFKYRLKNIINVSNMIVFGLISMMFSAIILYLKKEELSLNLTVFAYLVLILGVISQIILSKKRDNN